MAESNVQRISRVVIQPARNCFVKIHVKLINDKKNGRKENFHNLFTTEDGRGYLTLDLQSFLTIELKDRDKEWSKDKSVLLDEKNIYHVLAACEKMIKSIYEGNIFAISKETGKTFMYKGMREEHTVNVYNIGSHQRMVMQPAIIADEQDNTEYEGVLLFLNKTENFIELPIDAFESMYYALKQVNMFVYSQQLINYYMASVGKVDVTTNTRTDAPASTTVRKRHPMEKPPSEEFVKSTLAPPKGSTEASLGLPTNETP